MGCSASQSAAIVPSADADETDNKPMAIPPPTSFEIALEPTESLIKKHPPRRLEERLTKQLSSPPTTISDVCDKLASAELRRQSILRERVNNIRNNLRKEGIEEDGFPEEEETNEDGDNKEQISNKAIILEKL